jgi:hypothetical protein
MDNTMRLFLASPPPTEGELIRHSVDGEWRTSEVLHVERRVHVGGKLHMTTAGWDVWLAEKESAVCDRCGLESCFWNEEPCPDTTSGCHSF